MKRFTSIEEFKNYKPLSSSADEIFIKVGMSTCGIAAGAEKIFDIMQHEIERRHLASVKIKKVGCLGLCYCEPNIEVLVPGMPPVLYGNVDDKCALRIMEEHVCDHRIVNEHVYDKPYIDVLTVE